jgi:hypothetical protein
MFKYEYAKNNFKRMKRIGYSCDLIELLASMIEPQEGNRIDIQGVIETLKFKRFAPLA